MGVARAIDPFQVVYIFLVLNAVDFDG